jgi:prevent-host-death family protein
MKATRRKPEIVTRNGKPVSVIVPIKDYEELLERAEDTEDLAWLKQARRKKLHYRPLDTWRNATANRCIASSPIPR